MKYKAKITKFIDQSSAEIKIFGEFKDKTSQWIDITTREPSRTLKQHNFYHLWIEFSLPFYKLRDPTTSHEELHEYYKQKFLCYWKLLGDDMVRFVRSTTELSIMEFCDFLEQCFVTAIEDCFCPVGLFQDDYIKWRQEHGLE